ncbi:MULTISPECIES: ATP-binding protein [unclassified Streptomyces]|uniref:sensor histidine kinase n=1 Tax=unclassified Streptomyces TaxID=2593676 RepID=UPI002E354014|nr:ATP-binding protein [Streptomyces sp. NBC_01268]
MSASPSPFRPALTASLLTAAAGGALTVAAVTAAPADVRSPIAWFAACGVLLLSAASFAVTWYARALRALTKRADRLAAQVSSQDAYAAHRQAAADSEAAALRERHEATAAAEAAAHAARAEVLAEQHRTEAEELARRHRAEAERLATEHAAGVARMEERVRRAESARSAALAAAANAAGRMQALATSMMADLREMEHRHADEDVLADLLHLDHRTAQAGRLADSVAVLTGARSGRRWARPIVMESILRGAMGRIAGYQRVRLHSRSEAAVAGHAAEGVMHALAEILDNAANFSPPSAEVHVYVEEVPAGVVITVEDSGLTMSDVQLRRAESAVDATTQDLGRLSGTRLGLHVVGRLARKHNLSVSFRPSARGGTGVVLMLPQEIISQGAEAPAAAPLPIPAQRATPPAAPAAAVTPAAGPEAAPASPDETDANPEAAPEDIVLPRRKRGKTLAAHQEATRPAAERPAPRTADSPTVSIRFGGFHKAVRGAESAPCEAAREGSAPDDSVPDGSAPDQAAAPATPPSSNHPHSEGDPR